jgi:sugar fermentation stimulation protein A
VGSELLAAFFVDRPNRFVVEAVLEDGRRVRAHLADPGRLRELLLPGAPLRIRPVPPAPGRQTRHTVALVRSPEPPRAWVSVDTGLANRLAESLLTRPGGVRGIGKGWDVRREVRRGGSRFDFLLSRAGEELLAEVKSVTLVENGIARFPDAPTARGARHVRELAEVARAGERALILFVVQRGDARAVTANPAIDPLFAAELTAARRQGVLLRAASFHFTPAGRPLYRGPLPLRT